MTCQKKILNGKNDSSKLKMPGTFYGRIQSEIKNGKCVIPKVSTLFNLTVHLTVVISLILTEDFSIKWVHNVEGDSLPSSPEGSDTDDEPQKDTTSTEDDEV